MIVKHFNTENPWLDCNQGKKTYTEDQTVAKCMKYTWSNILKLLRKNEDYSASRCYDLFSCSILFQQWENKMDKRNTLIKHSNCCTFCVHIVWWRFITAEIRPLHVDFFVRGSHFVLPWQFIKDFLTFFSSSFLDTWFGLLIQFYITKQLCCTEHFFLLSLLTEIKKDSQHFLVFSVLTIFHYRWLFAFIVLPGSNTSGNSIVLKYSSNTYTLAFSI